jgi:hypothetical protein
MPTPSPSRPRRRLLNAGAALAALGPAFAARAQIVRSIPASAELGRLRIGVFPEATIDGRPVRLGPGTRIYDESNVIRPPSTVDGERRVAFARGTMGEVNLVWLVTDAEYRDIAARIAAARRAAAQR